MGAQSLPLQAKKLQNGTLVVQIHWQLEILFIVAVLNVRMYIIMQLCGYIYILDIVNSIVLNVRMYIHKYVCMLVF